uniref:Serine/threonine-protein phosphatase 5-like n=1 Tax=Dermatophagoides pteronyssinus TaxID=6956 RepID=A0A6P6YB26_DERPT|nr:serine/threonine-protein phosphatase 5-like [Dermatophagoides pteronyssinus]
MPDQLVAKIIAKATQFSKTLPNVVRINSDVAKATVTVCGDIHGQYYDLLNIFKLNGKPSETNYYVFNGDFVDRGSFSLEVIITLYVCRLIWPKFIHLTRGNHESKDMTQLYGFKHETEKKTNSSIYNLFIESFEYLPLAHIISERIFVVHGGLPSTKGVTIDKINSLLRVKNSDPIITDLLWADPGVAEGTSASQRGVSHVFGPDYTEEFLKTNNLDLVIRSHEVKNSGWEKMHNDKLYTIFSAPNYCDTMQNLGAYLKFSFSKLHDKNWQVEPEIIEFKEVTHPSVPAMQYSAFNF